MCRLSDSPSGKMLTTEYWLLFRKVQLDYKKLYKMQEIDDVEDGELSDEASNEYVRSSTFIFYWF